MPNLTELPPEVIDKVFSQLQEVADKLALRLVCRNITSFAFRRECFHTLRIFLHRISLCHMAKVAKDPHLAPHVKHLAIGTEFLFNPSELKPFDSSKGLPTDAIKIQNMVADRWEKAPEKKEQLMKLLKEQDAPEYEVQGQDHAELMILATIAKFQNLETISLEDNTCVPGTLSAYVPKSWGIRTIERLAGVDFSWLATHKWGIRTSRTDENEGIVHGGRAYCQILPEIFKTLGLEIDELHIKNPFSYYSTGAIIVWPLKATGKRPGMKGSGLFRSPPKLSHFTMSVDGRRLQLLKGLICNEDTARIHTFSVQGCRGFDPFCFRYGRFHSGPMFPSLGRFVLKDSTVSEEALGDFMVKSVIDGQLSAVTLDNVRLTDGSSLYSYPWAYVFVYLKMSSKLTELHLRNLYAPRSLQGHHNIYACKGDPDPWHTTGVWRGAEIRVALDFSMKAIEKSKGLGTATFFNDTDEGPVMGPFVDLARGNNAIGLQPLPLEDYE